MNYNDAIEILYNQAPMFQNIGKRAYKTGLETTFELDRIFQHPHRKFRTIHVAGTNGKGSCSHLISAVLQKSGYKVGLYTSPHLKDFRERIRINGEMISEEAVCEFVELAQPIIAELQPSFFEITTAMAFRYFAMQNVDVAVIEVGLGGRLDCTNIIDPELSIITNISIDHTDLLGATLPEIAYEKAGVIKAGKPAIIGEREPEVAQVFISKATEVNAPIYFASDEMANAILPDCEMKGYYQDKNRRTVLTAIRELRRQNYFNIPDQAIVDGFAKVCHLTGIMGRWQLISENPRIICDTGHNEAGIKFVTEQLLHEKFTNLRIIIGMVSDKKIDKVLALLPKNAIYYFTKAQIPRALNEVDLQKQATEYGLCGDTYPTIEQALNKAKQDYIEGDLIFVGGSNFTVAEIL
jgi:dihydrofolate synthase/folylpolyglutamate synthase